MYTQVHIWTHIDKEVIQFKKKTERYESVNLM